jgi:CRP/FNR family cyclic AMP-dependent transcriptional regulator
MPRARQNTGGSATSGINIQPQHKLSPYGFEMIESCVHCQHRADYRFCSLSEETVEVLDKIRSAAVYPKGAILFLEGQEARGVFVLCHGTAKLTTSSEQGKTIILRIAGPGEVLGLSSAISDRPYEVTAETLEPAEANFISRKDLMQLLRTQGDVGMNAAQELSHHYHSAYRDVRSLGLATSAQAKIARLLLDWAQEAHGRDYFHMRLTHEEVSQLIGSSRETVTRVFSELKRKQFIQMKGARVTLAKKDLLTALANS